MTSERGTSRRGFLSAAAGMTALTGASGAATAQTDTSSGEDGGGGETHVVDMTDGLVFEPDSLTIAPGDTVTWENVGTIGHSVTAYEDDIPEDADYFASGGFDSEQAARDAYPGEGNIPGGESYSHTFEVEGTYEYFCIPHETGQMVGTIEVSTGGDDGGSSGGPPQVPDSAKTLGIAATFGMVGTLGFAVGLLKYGGSGQDE